MPEFKEGDKIIIKKRSGKWRDYCESSDHPLDTPVTIEDVSDDGHLHLLEISGCWEIDEFKAPQFQTQKEIDAAVEELLNA